MSKSMKLVKNYDKTCWKASFAAIFVWGYQWTPQTTWWVSHLCNLNAFYEGLFQFTYATIVEVQPQKLKILGTAACVQTSILTVVFHQKRSLNRAFSVKYQTCPLNQPL